jgi:hypothetical protein
VGDGPTKIEQVALVIDMPKASEGEEEVPRARLEIAHPVDIVKVRVLGDL